MPKKPSIHDIERLVDKFKFERYIYLILIALSAMIIMVVAVVAFVQGDWETGLSLLAPGGAIFFCLSRVFKMWDDIMKVLYNKSDNQETNE